jgi:ribonuclease P protein component
MSVRPRKITQFTKQEIDLLWKKVHPVIKHDGFILLKAPRQGTFGRILIVIPKKIGNAPVRNKLRRQIKAIFYENELFKKDYDWIIITKKPITSLNFQDLSTLLLAAMGNPPD